MPLPLSVLIPARDEEKRIGRCLASLRWADEVVLLLDSRTQDGTAARAATFPNVRVVSTPWQGYGTTKATGIAHTRNEWVFWIDADEEVSETLQREIENKFAVPSALPDAFDVPRRTWFVDGWILHSGWYPGRVVRLFRKACGTFNDNILHEGVDLCPGARLASLQNDLLHYSYDRIGQFFEKMLRYGPLGAAQAMRQGKRFHMRDLVLRPLFTFFKFYILKRGFLDGSNGFVVCLGSAFSTFIRYAHLRYETPTLPQAPKDSSR